MTLTNFEWGFGGVATGARSKSLWLGANTMTVYYAKR